jgi:hypothetical protein
MARKLFWFAALYVAGVVVTGAVAFAIKAALPH